MAERIPAEGIRRHREILDRLADDIFIERLLALPPLPQTDDDDPAWDDDETWDRAEQLIAFADAIGDRGLTDAIPPLFERAALGDAYEMMRSIRHGPERAVGGDRQSLVQVMIPLVSSRNPGCRRWAVRELGTLRDPATLPIVLNATADPEAWVRDEACNSVAMIIEATKARASPAVRERLHDIAREDESAMVRKTAASVAAELA